MKSLIQKKKKDFFFHEVRKAINEYLFVTELTIDQFPFDWGVFNTPMNSELHVTHPKRHARSRASQLN